MIPSLQVSESEKQFFIHDAFQNVAVNPANLGVVLINSSPTDLILSIIEHDRSDLRYRDQELWARYISDRDSQLLLPEPERVLPLVMGFDGKTTYDWHHPIYRLSERSLLSGEMQPNDLVLAYFKLRVFSSDVARLWHIELHPYARGQGLGAKWYDETISAFARDRGFNFITGEPLVNSEVDLRLYWEARGQIPPEKIGDNAFLEFKFPLDDYVHPLKHELREKLDVKVK